MRRLSQIVIFAGLSITCAIPTFADSSTCATDDKLYTVTPCSASLGSTTKIVIKRDLTVSNPNDPAYDNNYSLKCATVEPQGSKVTAPSGFDSSQANFLTGSLQVDATAPVSNNFLLLKIYLKTSCPDTTKAPQASPPPLQELVPFNVTSLPPPGAIPTDKPQVDVAWKVLPRTVTSDNFGARVAKLYYAVVVYIGNNAGYDLQLAGVYFHCRRVQDADSVDPYRVVRSSLQREQVRSVYEIRL